MASFPSGLTTTPLNVPLHSVIRAINLTYLILLDLIIRVLICGKYKSWSLSLSNLLHFQLLCLSEINWKKKKLHGYTFTQCTIHTPYRSQYAAIALTAPCTSFTQILLTKRVIFSQELTLAPWRWFLCKPKHVGAFLSNLECFNNSAFFNVMCISW